MRRNLDTLYLNYLDIAWLSHYDGPGHRVVLYLQGCHLRCPWCHSPHSQATGPLLLYFLVRCLHCGRCAQVCPYGVHQVTENSHIVQRDRCVGCGKCIDACPVSHRDHLSGALALPGKQVSVSELWYVLYPQLDLLRSIGGLTVSGGEALLQSEPLAGLLRLCKEEGIHTAVETSGALLQRHIKDVMPLTDCWLYGLRPTPFYTPPFAAQIADNLAFLAKEGKRIIIRTPIIAGITDLQASLEDIAEMMQENGLHEIQLLPFNRETSHFYHALGRKCQVGDEAVVTSGQLETVRDFFLKRGFSATVVL